MNLLHVGNNSPHVHHLMSVFARFAPGVQQQHLRRSRLAAAEPADIAIVYNCTDHPAAVHDARKVARAVVGYVWNQDWQERSDLPPVLASCDLVIGDAESRCVVPEEKWHGFRAMPWGEVFHPPERGAVRDIRVLVARGWNGHPAYWHRETKCALKGMEGVVLVNGRQRLTPQQMADLYRRSRCVVALREDSGVAYSVVEAALCGAIPVVSDTPMYRQHFNGAKAEGDFREQGAALVKQDTLDIQDALYSVELNWVEFPEQMAREVARNLRHFAPWTAEVQGPALVERVLEVARVPA